MASPAFAESRGNMTVVASDTKTLSATVQRIDPDTRTITLKKRSGEMLNMEVSPDVAQLDKIGEGDRIRVEYLEPVALAIEHSGQEGSPAKVPDRVLLRDERDRSSETEVETELYTATVKNVDRIGRAVMLRKSNGDTFRVLISSNVGDLQKIKLGDQVTTKATPLLAVEIDELES